MIRIYLSKLLGEKRWSQADIARRTGIRPSTINEMYHEIIPRINVDHLDKICEALDCRIEDLVEFIPNKYPTTGEHLILEEHGNRKNT
ncbi:MAG: helix-turn-helix transcriptional regulator [Angelakisella sp.]